jgi:Zn-dependent protease
MTDGVAPPPGTHNGEGVPRRAPARSHLALRVATVAGIDIRIHVSFLLLVGLVALGSTAPGGVGLVPGLAWLAALFACVVAHEVSHGVVARRYGIPVLEIELLPIGGVSKLGRSPDDPGVELRIALAGPAMSVALAAVFAAAAAVAGVAVWPPDLYGGAFLARLAWVNLLLAGFNLLPALPLDGGRVFRAVLEERTDAQRATVIAARTARFLAIGMIVAGLLLNVWLIVIGAFVYIGSWTEERAAVIHAGIKDLRVRDVMILGPVILPAGIPAAQAGRELWHGAQREFPVVGPGGDPAGVVTAAALLAATAEATVGDVADREAPTLGADDPLETSGLLGGDVAAAPVVEGGRVVGLARSADAMLLVQRVLRTRATAPR